MDIAIYFDSLYFLMAEVSVLSYVFYLLNPFNLLILLYIIVFIMSIGPMSYLFCVSFLCTLYFIIIIVCIHLVIYLFKIVYSLIFVLFFTCDPRAPVRTVL